MTARQSRTQDSITAEPRSVDLRDYALVVRRRWLTVLALMVLGAALGLGYTVYKGRVYSATAEVIVEPATQGPINPPAQPNLQVNMVTEQAVAESAPVAQLADHLMNNRLPGASPQAAAAAHLSVTVPALSNLLQITWQAGSPKAAQQGADAFADAYLIYRHGLLSGEIAHLDKALSGQVTTLQRQIRSVTAQLSNAASGSAKRQNLQATLGELTGQLTTASNTLASLPTYDVSGGKVIGAALPSYPAGLRRSIIVALGALIGLLAGLMVAFARDAFDERLREPAIFERKLGAPVLATLVLGSDGIGSRRGAQLATVARPGSRAADSVRTAKAVLTSVTAGQNLSSFVVVGVDGSVSSSQVAAELGVALAESGRKTLLIASDLHGSTLPQIFDVPNSSGLTNLLVGKADPEAVTLHPKSAGKITLPPTVARHLSLIPNGPPLAPPLSILDSVAMARFLKSLRDEYDFVLLDCPASNSAAEVLALARLVDGLVAVATEARSKGQAAEDLRQRLDQIDGNLVGGLLVTRSRISSSNGYRARPQAEQAVSPKAEQAVSPKAKPPAEKPTDDRAEPRQAAGWRETSSEPEHIKGGPS